MAKSRIYSSDTAKALAGSEYVRDKLISLLTIGPRSMGNTYYAIKCRVKSEDSLIEKIKQKKRQPDKRNYNASMVTDIVGLRILTVFSQDLLNATIDFLDFIEFCQSPGIDLFHGNSIDDAVQEIIVYKSKNNRAAYDLVHSRLKQVRLGSKPGGRSKLESLDSSPEQPYSSIHIVCNCVSHYAKAPKIIPLEVQIRTVFEDAWNELDHPLRYKGIIR